MNGIAYADDAQIADLRVSKVCAVEGEEPRTMVWIKPMGARHG